MDGGEVGVNGDATGGRVGDSPDDSEGVTIDGVIGADIGIEVVGATNGGESSTTGGVVCDNVGSAEVRLWHQIVTDLGWTRVAVQINTVRFLSTVSKYFLLIKVFIINVTSVYRSMLGMLSMVCGRGKSSTLANSKICTF